MPKQNVSETLYGYVKYIGPLVIAAGADAGTASVGLGLLWPNKALLLIEIYVGGPVWWLPRAWVESHLKDAGQPQLKARTYSLIVGWLWFAAHIGFGKAVV